MDPAGASAQEWQTGVERALLLPEPQASSSTLKPTSHPEQELKIPPPECYGGEPGTCRAFLTQYVVQFKLQPSLFPTEVSKVAYVLALLPGRAWLWAMTAWARGEACCAMFKSFSEEVMKQVDLASPRLRPCLLC